MNFLLGADPEVFLEKGGHFFSGFGLIKGDKQRPFKVDKGAVQVDGMALEFNIDPATCEEEFVNNIQAVMDTLQSMVPEYKLTPVPTAHFTPEYMSTQPEEALILGCEPDYCAYTGEANEKPDANVTFRTGAGHVHIGFTEGQKISDPIHKQTCDIIARELDIYLAIPSLIFDTDRERRALYGKAGCLRYKEYGLEYRVLSNKWLSSPELISWVYRSVATCLRNLSQGIRYQDSIGNVEQIINESDVEAAVGIIEELGLEVPNV